MNNEIKKLDEWDCKLIKLFKNQNDITEESIKELWAEACEFEIKYVSISEIASHLLDLAREIGLFNNSYRFKSFIFDLNKENNWKYVCLGRPYIQRETEDFNLILLSRLDSLFRNTNVDDLPGYREFIGKSS